MDCNVCRFQSYILFFFFFFFFFFFDTKLLLFYLIVIVNLSVTYPIRLQSNFACLCMYLSKIYVMGNRKKLYAITWAAA